MKKFRKRKTFHKKSANEKIRIFPLGGIGNVTKNMFVYEFWKGSRLQDILIVDCGIGFPDPEMYGVDILIPDVMYLEDKLSYIRGIVFTHGHDDHIGAIPYIYPKLGNVPMYATKLTAAFANLKLKEAKISQKVQTVDFQDSLQIGVFDISFVHMTHSVPDTANLVIRTPIGVMYHGSDFKFDFDPLDGKLSDLEKINKTGQEDVLCLLTDCLGSERVGFTQSEQIVGDTLEKELKQCHGRLIFTTQSSNISRIQRAVDIAQQFGRQVAFLGRSIDNNVEASVKHGYMKFPRDILVRQRDLSKMPPSKQFLIAAGSQGQPESALSRIANDDHRFARVDAGDTVVFSADPIPGNEYNFNLLIDQLYRKGVRVSYSHIMEDLHVSGHGSQGDLVLLLTALAPQYVFPIGGTYRHMVQYRNLAELVGYPKRRVLFPEEGDVLEFEKGAPPKITEHIDIENIMVDGVETEGMSGAVLRDRQTIATEGIVVIVIPINKSSGKVTADLDIISRGFVYMKDNSQLIQSAKKAATKSLKLKKGRIIDWQFVRTQIRRNVERLLAEKTNKHPLVVPVIIET